MLYKGEGGFSESASGREDLDCPLITFDSSTEIHTTHTRSCFDNDQPLVRMSLQSPLFKLSSPTLASCSLHNDYSRGSLSAPRPCVLLLPHWTTNKGGSLLADDILLERMSTAHAQKRRRAVSADAAIIAKLDARVWNLFIHRDATLRVRANVRLA